VFAPACLPQVEELTINVEADRVRISAPDTSSRDDQLTAVHSNITGGLEPYTIRWVVKDPMGQNRTELLDDPHSPDPVFRPGPLIGPYLLVCTVTDSRLTIVSDSTIIYVSQDLSLTLSVDRKEVPNGGGPNGQINVTSEVWGGAAPYTYEWSVTGPDGEPSNERLSGDAHATRLFTSGYELGTYRITCKVIDATGAIAVQTTEVIVNHLLSINVSSDRPMVVPGGGASGRAKLEAEVSGGKAPYTYSWVVLGPDGKEGDWLDDPTIVNPQFTSPSQPGTYRVMCTAVDARGQQVVGSMLIVVSQQLSVSVLTNRQRVSPDGGVSGRALLSALVTGGAAPCTYHWTVLDALGNDASDLIDNANIANPTFTSSGVPGTYQFICRVTDSVGQIATDSLEISVGQQVVASLTVTSSRSAAEGGSIGSNSEWVASGGGPNGQATITAEAIGGTPPYTYFWTIVGPDGNPADDRLSVASPKSRFFHSSNVLGTYRVTCTITDATGMASSDSVKIAVYSHLSLELITNRYQLPAYGGPDGSCQLQAVTVGGTAPFTYDWSVTAADGTMDNSMLDDPHRADPTFTSGLMSGIHRIKCVVRDSLGQTAEGTLLLTIGQPVTLDVRCDHTDVLAGGGQAKLEADARGGIPPYRYQWTVTNPQGDVENERLDDTEIANPTFTSSLTTGTYNFTCMVTDSAGYVAVLSTNLVVGGGLDQGLSVSISSDRQGLPASGGQAALFAAVLGGVPPVSFEWVVEGPDGDVTATALDNATITTPIFTAPATPGTYRIRCSVLDSVLKRFTDTLHIYVGMPLTLDVATEKSSLPTAGEQTILTATPHGGESPYTYAWTAVDPGGNDAAAALSDATIATPTFTAPATPGTYQFTCTVTDAAGATAISSVQVYVGMSLSVDVTTVKQSLPSGQTTAMNAAAQGGLPAYTYAWTVLDPSGTDVAATVLSGVDVAAPLFTAPAAAGTYRVTCTVADSANETAVQSVHVHVGMPLTLDVRTDQLGIPATGGQAILTATANGGVSPYTYAWTAADPNNDDAAAALDDLSIAAPTFTAPVTPGTYWFTCTVTDAAGTTAMGSVQVYVGMNLSLDVTATRQSLPSGQTSELSASAQGGIPGYTYAWSVLDPDGADVSATALSAVDVADPTFTAPTDAGTYRITCTVTDSANETLTHSIHLYVGMPLTLDVSTDRQGIPATGGEAVLTAIANGGVSPYTYAWTALDPSNGDAAATLSDTTVAAPTFTAPATAGTYRFACTVTDAAGTTAISSVQIYVGMGLSLDVTASKQSLPSGQTTALNAVAQGGIPGYTYAWSVLDPSGADASAALSELDVAAPTFTGPADAGTYRITCTVTDSANETIARSIHLYVGMPLTLDVQTDKLGIPATGGQAVLTATANGGVSPYTYAWTALDPSSGDAAATLSDTAVATPTFTAPATAGTYRFTCTVTDAAGTTAVSSIQIYVGMGLSLDVTATKQSLPSGQATALNASAQGGIPGYTYAWSVLDPGGADVSATALSAVDVASPTFTAPADAGTYRITCTVTDSANETITRSILVYVGMPLTLDVQTDKLGVPATGGEAVLTATVNGGVSPYTYAWTALDPSNSDAAATLSDAAVAAPTFTAPATAGTYRFTCTVTDAAGTTAVSSVQVYVGMGLSLDVTATKQSLPSGQTTALNASAKGGIPGYTYAWSVLDPSGADVTATTLSAADVATPTFIAPATAGTYRIACMVTDAANETIARSILLYVGMPLTLDVRTDKLSIPAAGGQATLTAMVNGGVSPYTYAWTALDPTNGDAAATLSNVAVSTPTFTAPATPGTYRFTCTVTDAAGTTAVSSIQIYVGMNLSLDVTTVKQSLPSGQTTTLNAAVQGGIPGHTYAWSVLDPGGTDASAALSEVDVAAPTFTAPATAGTYRVSCTVTDSANETVTQSIHVYVGMPLTLDVRTDRVHIPAAGGQAALMAVPNGGATPYTYEWTATDPSNGDAAAYLDDTTSATPTFTAPAAVGTYRFTCTVTDASGTTVAATVEVTVGMGLYVVLTTTKQSLPSGQTAELQAAPQGGAPGYTYAWSVLDPSGADVSATTLNAIDVANPTFTAPATAGTYRVTCTVTDVDDSTFTGSLHLYVGMPLTLDVRANRLGIPATGDQATLNAIVNGGVSPFTYAWTATDPSGGDASASLSSTTTAASTFTAPATPGTYRFACTVTDAAGTTAIASVRIYVGMNLSLDVTATKQSLPSGQTTALNAAAQGGIPAYSYAWTILDPSGADVSAATLSATNVVDPVFTAPADAGTYRITCTVTDSANETITRSIHLYVGMPLTLDVQTDKLGIPATGGQAVLTATANGGVSPYTYAWTALDPSNGDATATLSDAAVAAPTFTAPATAGTYRFTCTVTDAAGATAISSVQVHVGMGLSLDVTATKQSLPSGQTTALNAAVQGGIPGYTYAWSVLNPSGADVTATTLSAANVATPTFTAPATVGTYRIACTVTDAANETITRSILLYVGMPLTLDVRTDKLSIPAAGGQATLSAMVNGGVSPYTYAWTALDPSNGDAAATLSNVAVSTPTFTAPATPGTYRFACTVTDAAGTTAISSVQVYVGMNLSLSVTTVKQSLPAGQTTALNAAAQGGIPGYTYAWTALDPSGADVSAATLSATNVANPVFTAPDTPGTYRLSCTVTDAANETVTQSIHVYVGMPLTLDVRTNKLGIPAAGGQAVLTATVNGGVSPYTYAWTATDPSNGNAAATLSGTAVASPTFTAPATPGTYRFACTVTDAAGTTAISSVQIYVGMNLSLDVMATKQSLPSTKTTALSASAQGGIPGYTYAWSVLDPAGADASAALSSTSVADPTFTAPATPGTYRLTCTVTDLAGETVSRSIHVQVGMPLTLDVRTNKLGIPATGGQATLTANANGGVSPYTYAWTATDPSNGNAAATLSSTTVASPTFTAPAAPGTYRFTCTVTDAAGTTSVASVQIYVGMKLSLNLTTVKQSLPAGQTTALNAVVQGGIPGYTYAWTVLDPTGSNVTAGTLSASNVANPTFTAPAAAGTYRATCIVTDSANETVAQTIHIYAGQPLSIDVTARYSSIPAATGQTLLDVSVIGGVSPYTYAWTAVDQTGANATAAINDPTAAAPMFTAPASPGNYRITCTVTDASGASSIDSCTVMVGMPLSVYTLATRASMVAGRTATLSATASGGWGPYTYAWVVTNPSGAVVTGATLNDATIASPTFTAPATPGTYRVTCTVTDSRSATAVSSMHLVVGMPLSVDVTATKVSIVSGATSTLSANAAGGASPYTYAWSVKDSSGADASAALSNTTVASPVFTGPATPGTYTVSCTVTDQDGYTFTDSIAIVVGMPLSATVATNKSTLTAAETATLAVVANGGIPTHTYAWTVRNSAWADVTATTLNDATAQMPTFTAPYASGTYVASCTVTDAAGATFTAVVHLQVTTKSFTLTAPAAADDPTNPTSVMASTPLTNVNMVLTPDVDVPQYARNLRVRVTDPDASVTGSFFIVVEGIGPDGHYQSEFFPFTAPGAAGATVEGTKPFARVEIVRWARNGTNGTSPGGGDERVSIGVGNIFGLPHTIASASAVKRVVRLPATTLATPADYTVIATPGRQGVSFTNPANRPNGFRSYEIYYDPQ